MTKTKEHPYISLLVRRAGSDALLTMGLKRRTIILGIISYLIAFGLDLTRRGWTGAFEDFIVSVLYGLIGPASVVIFIFLFHLIRAPSLIHSEQSVRIRELEEDLEMPKVSPIRVEAFSEHHENRIWIGIDVINDGIEDYEDCHVDLTEAIHYYGGDREEIGIDAFGSSLGRLSWKEKIMQSRDGIIILEGKGKARLYILRVENNRPVFNVIGGGLVSALPSGDYKIGIRLSGKLLGKRHPVKVEGIVTQDSVKGWELTRMKTARAG